MEPFKNAYNEERIRQAADFLHGTWSGFDQDAFVARCLEGLDELELKARVGHIARALGQSLPDDWATTCDVMVASLAEPRDPDAPKPKGKDSNGVGLSDPLRLDPDPSGIRGWMIWPMTFLVGAQGLDQPTISLQALHSLTQRWSAEFAIRAYLQRWPELTLATLGRWVEDPSPHVRRLVSEGTRPRLPWGIRLQQFIDDPSPTLALLERLVDDDSEYVRRSVANHLGDIAKDDAALAVTVAGRWWSDTRNRQRLVTHGLRWLIKQGDPGALKVVGYGPAQVRARLSLTPTSLEPGDQVAMSLELTSTTTTAQPLMIDYAVHHVKANGKRTPKVFKWTRRELGPGKTLTLDKTHAMRIVSTRRYYPGTHRIEVQVNGKSVAGADFELTAGGA